MLKVHDTNSKIVINRFDDIEISCAFHDIDGTHSLIREWPPVMSICLYDVIEKGLAKDFDSEENAKRLIDLAGTKALEETDGCKTIIVDFHAEATAEKRAMGFYLDGKVTALVGTHTHVQTADEQILPNGTAYITDLGMCGPVQSVLGIEPELTIKKFKSNLPVRFENAKGEYSLDGCLIDIDEKTGKANSIERVNIR